MTFFSTASKKHAYVIIRTQTVCLNSVAKKTVYKFG